MRSPSFVRSISSKLSMVRRSTSPTVAPLPEQSRFSDEVTSRLDQLRSLDRDCGISSSWLVEVLDATINSQIVAQEYLNDTDLTISGIDMGRKMIDDYLEDNVQLLDACNGLIEKMSIIQKYIDIVQTTIHFIDSTSEPTLVRKHEIFNEYRKIEEECDTLDKCSPKLHKLIRQNPIQIANYTQDRELIDVLSGSKEIASMGCHIIQRALSFKSRQGVMKMRSKLPTTWSSSLNELQSTINDDVQRRKKSSPWMMKELEVMVMDAKALHNQVKSKNRNVDVVLLKIRCEALEEGIISLEERVTELYKHLISIRMTLLGLLSRN